MPAKLLALIALAVGFSFVPIAYATGEDEAAVTRMFASNTAPRDRATLREFATCVANRYSNEVQLALRQQADLSQLKQSYPHLVDLSCFPAAWFKTKSMAIADGLYQSLLGEALLAFEYPSSGSRSIPDLSAVPPREHPTLPKVDIASLPAKYREFFLAEWALHRLDVISECVVRAAPATVLQLSRTVGDSPQEEAMLTNLRKFMAGCQSATMAFAPPSFLWRMYLTSNLYQLFDIARPIPIEKSGTHA